MTPDLPDLPDLIAGLLPAGVQVEQCTGVLEGRLLLVEQSALGGMAPARRDEFVTGRLCARAALQRLGVGGLAGPPAVPRDVRGAPVWPAGVVGSLTHCPGLWVVAVARRSHLAGLGIDAEPHAALPEGVLDVVASAREQRHLADLHDRAPGVAWDRLLFSAKESVYKLWWPATGRWLDFEQVEVRLRPDGLLSARLRSTGLVLRGRTTRVLRGRWTADAGHLVSAVAG